MILDLARRLRPIDAGVPEVVDGPAFGPFVRRMFPGYLPGRHLDLLVSALERAVETPGARLIVTMPPRHSKSVHVSEHLPAWYLGRHPDRRVIAASHSASLAYTFSRRVRAAFSSPAWPFPAVHVAGDLASVQRWDVEGRRGGYVAVGVGGTPTGQGADLLVIDDPIRSAADADSDTVREALWEWYQGTIRTRLEPGAVIVLTATRWHQDDLTGRLLAAHDAGGEAWEHVHLPAIDADGDALWPERWPIAELERTRTAIGARAWASQYQGRPSPVEGTILRREWWRFWHFPGQPLPPVPLALGDGRLVMRPCAPLPPAWDDQVQSWDMSFKGTASSDFVVGQVWGAHGANRYLLAQDHRQLDFPDTVRAVEAMVSNWPMARTRLIEDKANGPAVIATLRDRIPGLIAVEPEGGKVVRVHAVTPTVEAGNVFLPHPNIAPWVWGLIDECAAFPAGANDDQVDAMSQALIRLSPKSAARTYSTSYIYGRPDDDDGFSPYARRD